MINYRLNCLFCKNPLYLHHYSGGTTGVKCANCNHINKLLFQYSFFNQEENLKHDSIFELRYLSILVIRNNELNIDFWYNTKFCAIKHNKTKIFTINFESPITQYNLFNFDINDPIDSYRQIVNRILKFNLFS